MSVGVSVMINVVLIRSGPESVCGCRLCLWPSIRVKSEEVLYCDNYIHTSNEIE